MQPRDPHLREIYNQLSDELWKVRVEAAQAEAAVFDRALVRIEAGEPAVRVLEALLPDKNPQHQVRRLRRYRREGLEALIDRRFVKRTSKMTPEVQTAVRAALAADPTLRSGRLIELVRQTVGVEVPGSTMRQWLHQNGLSQRSGPPPSEAPNRAVGAVALPNAGAELLKALDELLGATLAMTDAVTEGLAALPAPTGPVRDDRPGRNGVGHFTAEYNALREQRRTEPELGEAFGSVEGKRQDKDLPGMRLAQTRPETRLNKDRALTYLPILVEGARLSELGHWRGEQLSTLVGTAYQPATLDKYLRELKYAGASGPMQEGLTSFWATQGPPHEGAAVVLYCDGFTTPLWTRFYSKSTLVTRTGRIQPATETLFLHSGAGTPLIYETHSGGVSLPQRLVEMLQTWERVAGAGTARRLVVIDREGHAVAALRALGEGGWLFLVPVRKNCAKPDSPWEDVGEWVPLDPGQPDGPAVREAVLSLNDSKDRDRPLRVRAITRRASADDAGATWATNASTDLFTAAELLELYSGRWVHQEHVFRDANGRVGLGRHHGYGKQKVAHLAVIDEREKLSAQARRLRERIARAAVQQTELSERLDRENQAVVALEQRVKRLGEELREAMIPGAQVTPQLHETHHVFEQLQRGLTVARQVQRKLEAEQTTKQRARDRLVARAQAKEARHEALERKTEIFTVDVELDQIMTAYKLTFLNLCHRLMRDHLDVTWQIDRLIRAVLTLPGRRRQTPKTETIEIFRQERDPQAMVAVERACQRMTAEKITRGDRILRFSVIDPP